MNFKRTQLAGAVASIALLAPATALAATRRAPKASDSKSEDAQEAPASANVSS